jgi:hypothetical protein
MEAEAAICVSSEVNNGQLGKKKKGEKQLE